MSRGKLGVVLFSTAVTVVLVLGGLLGKSTSAGEGAYKQLGVYSEVLSRVKSDYVEEPNLQEVTDGALHGLLESLDPFSSYLTPDEYAAYKKKAPEKGDLGLVVSKKFGYVAVITAVPGGPAARSGLMNGDIIEAIDGASTREMSIERVRTLFNGKPGSSITLSIVRASRAEPQRVTLKREVVAAPPVTVKQVEAGVGYLKVDSFPKGRAHEVAQRIQQLVTGGAHRLVLDLRSAADGEISEGVAIADLFLDRGLITYAQGQKYPRQNFNAEGGPVNVKLPLVVLVNRGSAGPAEVIAAAIQENGRGEVVGEKTYGVGSIQKVIPLDDGSALILSIAKYYTPGGKSIQDNAVTPSVLVADAERPTPEVDQDQDEEVVPETRRPEERPVPREDLPLKRAIEILKGSAEKKAA